MEYELKKSGDFNYIETGGGDNVLMLLHGLFGALSNFEGILNRYSDSYNVVVPILPIYDMPFRKLGLRGLVKHVDSFVDTMGYEKVNVLGNSLGGHITLLYALHRPDKTQSIVLTGSSGLFESAMGSTFPKRGNYEFIKEKTQSTFYDPNVATDELVDEVFEIVNNRNKAIRVIAIAKSAVRNNLGDKLHMIKAPTCLIWGKQDNITPPFVGEKFHELLTNSELHFIDKCGHAPMMEHPEKFNLILDGFLQKVNS
nr:alpha/beta hydrolase [Saprospiraceae bacterium]